MREWQSECLHVCREEVEEYVDLSLALQQLDDVLQEQVRQLCFVRLRIVEVYSYCLILIYCTYPSWMTGCRDR